MALNNSQYEMLRREYDRMQREDREEAAERKREVYGKDSRLQQIDEQMASLAVAQAEKLLSGEADSVAELHTQLEAFREEKKGIIRSLGYDEDFFVPAYHCADCKDTGYIGAQKCHCFVQRSLDLVYEQSNLQGVLTGAGFDHFSLEYYAQTKNKGDILSPYEAAELALEKSRRFTEDFGKTFQNLCFYGNTGVGKTFLGNCIAKELLARGYSVVYFTAPNLFDIFEKDVFQKDPEAKSLRGNIYDVDLLLIDDLGTEIGGSFTSSQFYLTLNERILRKKPVIISTNLKMSEITDRYSERTFSRISSYYTVIHLMGDDIRMQKKLKAQ
ncbi:MAG: ATP-binding protein [Lachnospiraceae bacterium]|nr:ATP-binding protein [Lachnospiraceae bacterium]